jgi:hypothetical protein
MTEFSLGMSRSKSLADIGESNFSAMGLCSTGRITIEIIKFLGTGAVIMGLGWKFLEATKPNKM